MTDMIHHVNSLTRLPHPETGAAASGSRPRVAGRACAVCITSSTRSTSGRLSRLSTLTRSARSSLRRRIALSQHSRNRRGYHRAHATLFQKVLHPKEFDESSIGSFLILLHAVAFNFRSSALSDTKTISRSSSLRSSLADKTYWNSLLSVMPRMHSVPSDLM